MKVVVVDYGMGNLHSVLKSVQAAQKLAGVRAEIELTDAPEKVFAADKIIFPGQGAMPDCMAALQQSGLGEAVFRRPEKQTFFRHLRGRAIVVRPQRRGQHTGLGLVCRRGETLCRQPARCARRQAQSCRIWAGTRCTKRRRTLCLKALRKTRAFTLCTAIISPRPRPKLCWAAANIRMNSPVWWVKTMYLPRNFTPKKATMAACCFCVIFALERLNCVKYIYVCFQTAQVIARPSETVSA